MGYVRVPVKLFVSGNGQSAVEIEMLVDTGAIFTLVPRSILEKLGVQPTGKRRFRTIEGEPIERDVGGIDLEIDGSRPPAEVPVIFGDEGDVPVLGVTALESMGLTVDPSAGILRPTDLLMLMLGGRT